MSLLKFAAKPLVLPRSLLFWVAESFSDLPFGLPPAKPALELASSGPNTAFQNM